MLRCQYRKKNYHSFPLIVRLESLIYVYFFNCCHSYCFQFQSFWFFIASSESLLVPFQFILLLATHVDWSIRRIFFHSFPFKKFPSKYIAMCIWFLLLKFIFNLFAKKKNGRIHEYCCFYVRTCYFTSFRRHSFFLFKMYLRR